MPLKKVDPLAVRAFYRELRESGVGEATVHAIKANLVRVFNQPLPAGDPGPALREAVALTPDAARAALACGGLTPRERAMLATFLLAGLRLSERMALTRGQLMLDKGLIAVDRAVRLDSRGGQSVGLPKDDKRRVAVMCPTLKAALCAVVADLPSEAHVWPAEGKDKPRMKRSVYRTWKGIARLIAPQIPADE